MADVSFYHLLHTPLERALPRLMEKIYRSGARAVVRAGSEERAEFLSGVLWTYDPGSFLPHGTARDGRGDRQPIWITPDRDNPNGAGILVLTDGAAAPDVAEFERCLDMFDGRDADALAAARERWKRCKEHAPAYWRQTPHGGWEKKA